MITKKLCALSAAAALLTFAPASRSEQPASAPAAGAAAKEAHAVLKDAKGAEVGTVTFTEVDGKLRVAAEFSGLAEGDHGFHVHEAGKCEAPDFKSAGAHFNPMKKKHGMENPEGHHAGDLPNLEVDKEGKAKFDVTTGDFSLGAGETSLLDADGSAVVVHAKADDMKTDPSGDSGDRIACGVITAGAAEAGDDDDDE